jgi:Acetyltransferase (GNAT) domain
MVKPDKQVRVERYEARHKACWDEFVRQSKNGVFLFYRDYMEYHADRFSDCSLLFFQGDQLIAVMPVNQVDETVVSHGGLTFGGIVSDSKMTTTRMLRVFSALLNSLRARGIKKLIYKAIPHMYHLIPAEEDLYALFAHNAHLLRRDVSSTVVAGQRPPLTRNRRKTSNRVKALGLKVERSQDFSQFMAIAEASLQSRHGSRPVHSAAEMQLLAKRFPENIKLFTAELRGEMLGGVIMYESEVVAHGQYRHATEEGMKLGVLDSILDALVNEFYTDKPFLDFGTSMLDDGRTLNADLIRNKESFGARATVYDSYELDIGAQHL